MSVFNRQLKFVYVIGAPASGKGTLCSLLASRFQCYHMSVGDLMREVSKDPSSSQQEVVATHLKQGILLPFDILCQLLSTHIESKISQGRSWFLIDGFPRAMEQGLALERVLGPPSMILFFDCPKEIAQERYLNRKLPGRMEDDEKMFDKRYAEYEQKNRAIVEHYVGSRKLQKVDTSTDTTVTFENLTKKLAENEVWLEFLEVY